MACPHSASHIGYPAVRPSDESVISRASVQSRVSIASQPSVQTLNSHRESTMSKNSQTSQASEKVHQFESTLSSMPTQLGFMRQVRNLEATAFERMKQIEECSNRRIDEMTPRIDDVVTVTMEAVQNLWDTTRLQVAALEAAVADLRSEFGTERERQDLQAESVKLLSSTIRQDISTLQTTCTQAMTSQASQDAVRACIREELEESRRDIGSQHTQQDFTSIVAASQASLQDRLQQQLDEVRQEIARERSQSSAHVETIKSLENSSRAIEMRLDQSQSSSQAERIPQEIAQLREALEFNKAEVDRLGRELGEERAERYKGICDIARISEDGRAQSALILDETVVQLKAAVGTNDAEVKRLTRELVERDDRLKAICESPRISARGASQSVLEEKMVQLKTALSTNQGEVERLGRELGEERTERYKALCDIARITEDVAKAAATTIETAERRFAEATSVKDSSRPGLRLENVSAPPPEWITTALTSDEVRGGLEGVVKNALANSMQKLRTDIGGRVAAVENRIGTVEARMGNDLSVRLGKIESGQLDLRIKNLESEVRRNSVSITSFQEDRASNKVKANAYQAMETDMHLALAVGQKSQLEAREQIGHTSHRVPRAASPVKGSDLVPGSTSVCSTGTSEHGDSSDGGAVVELSPGFQKIVEGLVNALQISLQKNAQSVAGEAIGAPDKVQDKSHDKQISETEPPPVSAEAAMRLEPLLKELNVLMQATTHKIKGRKDQDSAGTVLSRKLASERAAFSESAPSAESANQLGRRSVTRNPSGPALSNRMKGLNEVEGIDASRGSTGSRLVESPRGSETSRTLLSSRSPTETGSMGRMGGRPAASMLKRVQSSSPDGASSTANSNAGTIGSNSGICPPRAAMAPVTRKTSPGPPAPEQCSSPQVPIAAVASRSPKMLTSTPNMLAGESLQHAFLLSRGSQQAPIGRPSSVGEPVPMAMRYSHGCPGGATSQGFAWRSS